MDARPFLIGVLLGFQAAIPPASFPAVSIQYEIIDVPDGVPGASLWEYHYRVAGDFGAFQGFNVLFDSGQVSSIDDFPTAPNDEWSVSTTQPIGAPLFADGVYNALALIGGAATARPFIVQFAWTGPGVPGTQSFEVFDSQFNPLESGTTQPVPEPASWAMLAAGLALVLTAARRRLV